MSPETENRIENKTENRPENRPETKAVTNIKKKRKKRPVLQRRPFAPLYEAAAAVASIVMKRKFNLSCTGEKIKGPALLISNHASNHDYKFIAVAGMPARISFVATNHWFTFRKLGIWLRICGAIPKYQFSTDLECMKKIRYVVQQKKGIVFIAPEGTVYASGHLGYMSPAIAKMIRFLKVPVYASRIQGAGLGNAKWSAHTHTGKVNIDTHLLFTAEEAVSLKPDEMMERITEALSYNEFEFQRKEGFTIKGNDKAEGFETMFYRCPCCESEFTLSSKGNDVTCSNCGAVATFQDDFSFRWNTPTQYFTDYSQWYDWQYEKVLQEVSNPDFLLEDEVDYGIDEPGVDNYIKVGHGKLTFSHAGWDYKGTFKGEPYEEHEDCQAVFLATLKIGLHIELPNKNGHNRVFYPTNGLTSMKWHLASRAMSELNGR